ncbi:YbaB/EbfC family nucleoid-associated protein [Solwaraspora sp. WMMD1047]|uniref:YbaB/EbfC family nucleoid-associated protein n=1 Tax=Solwaraspora sp. WMMD1047 TaxID=3016102 RepID=UPI00241637FD|nr:YbaB/EbfC family nucleoid-associated protein [Solwaraspora sp. WMMD1047]MDG4831849.1 YbaB/EbfC family nucleoid-associated protein [Solwaraspora sp. WMMD1047]
MTSVPLPVGPDRKRLHADLLTIQRRIGEVRVTAESDDGLVTATVGGRGELVELALDPRVYRDPDSRLLARLITETIRRAGALAADQVFALSRAVLAPRANRADTDLGFDVVLRQLEREMSQEDRHDQPR